jgi:hypothetical protein
LNIGLLRLLPVNAYLSLSLVSIVSSSITAALLYKTTKSYLAPLLWLGSTLVISQSVILESYALITLLILVTYQLYIANHRKLAYLVIGLGIMIHHLVGLFLILFFVNDYLQKRSLKPILFALFGLPLLLYIPLVNNPPFIWIDHDNYLQYWFSQGGLVGGISIIPADDIIRRLKEFSTIIVASFGILTPFLILSIHQEFKRKNWILPTAFLFYIVYYITDLDPQTYTYMLPSITLGILLLHKIRIPVNIHKLTTISLIVIIPLNLLLLFHIDKLAAKDFYDQLDRLPSNSAVWTSQRGWERLTIEWWNRNHKRHIEPLYLYKPYPSRGEFLTRLIQTQSLYRTRVVDKRTQYVEIERATPTEIYADFRRLSFTK